MKQGRIKKIILYTISVVFLFILIGGFAGMRYFNNMWFNEKPDHLGISSDLNPITFEWTETTYGDYTEKKDAIIIPAKIEGIGHRLYFQFDTGDPTTRVYRNALESLKKMGLEINEISRNEKQYIDKLEINLGGSQIILKMVAIDDNSSASFILEDTLSNNRIGTVGADFINKNITEIDFKNQFIQFYKEREDWMTAKNEFTPFDFTGRRFMLPCGIDNKKFELFYDSGSSAFGLITTKGRYKNYSNNDSKEITYGANRHGDAIPIKHKSTDEIINIGGLDVALKRVSYVDMYSDFQGLMSPFTKIGGWLGNKPFIDYSLIFDARNQEFIVVKK